VFCGECGAQLKEGARFCTSCGAAVPAGAGAAADAPDEVDELHERLQQALNDYSALVEEAATADLDDGAFLERAFKLGLIVRDNDAWLLDLPTSRWWRYDGYTLSPLGGLEK
jgi:hypothetical protein